jgi:hypothetical protein
VQSFNPWNDYLGMDSIRNCWKCSLVS